MSALRNEELLLFGQRGYEAYSKAAGGRSLVSGDPLPGWDALPEAIQQAWVAAAAAIIDMDQNE